MISDHTVSAMRPEMPSLSPSEWKPDKKMKSFHHHLISASLRHIRGPFTVKPILIPNAFHVPGVHRPHAGVKPCKQKRKWVRGERLNHALIQLVRLASCNPLLNAQAQEEMRQRKGGEDRKPNQEMPPK